MLSPGAENVIRVDPLELSKEERSRHAVRSYASMRESGWHPIIRLTVRTIGPWTLVSGIDPIEDRRVNILIKLKLSARGMTFFRVRNPKRLQCDLEQIALSKSEGDGLASGRGWFGVESVDEARLAKAANDGDIGAMRELAFSRSYRFLRDGNTIADVSQFLDLSAAKYWFGEAAKSGSVEADFELTYLDDVIAQSREREAWLAAHPKLSIQNAPVGIRNALGATLIRSVCARIGEFERLYGEFSSPRREETRFLMTYHIRKLKTIADALRASTVETAAHLSQAILQYLERHPINVK